MNFTSSEKSQLCKMLKTEMSVFIQRLPKSHEFDLCLEAQQIKKLSELCIYFHGDKTINPKYFLNDDDQYLFQTIEECLSEELYNKICAHFDVVKLRIS